MSSKNDDLTENKFTEMESALLANRG